MTHSTQASRLRGKMLAPLLPSRRRHRQMQLQSSPLGKDFFETEKILLDLQKKLQLNHFALPEIFWILYPPIGPRPAASWGAFPFKSGDENPVSVYIISIEVMYTDGVTRHVVKPGVSRRAIIGHKGRYPKAPHVSLLYEKKELRNP